MRHVQKPENRTRCTTDNTQQNMQRACYVGTRLRRDARGHGRSCSRSCRLVRDQVMPFSQRRETMCHKRTAQNVLPWRVRVQDRTSSRNKRLPFDATRPAICRPTMFSLVTPRLRVSPRAGPRAGRACSIATCRLQQAARRNPTQSARAPSPRRAWSLHAAAERRLPCNGSNVPSVP